MTQPGRAPSAWHVQLDAWQRAVRTFVAGLVASVVVSIVPAVLILLGTVRFTREWGTVALATLGTVTLNAIASYIARYIKAPSQDKLPSAKV